MPHSLITPYGTRHGQITPAEELAARERESRGSRLAAIHAAALAEAANRAPRASKSDLSNDDFFAAELGTSQDRNSGVTFAPDREWMALRQDVGGTKWGAHWTRDLQGERELEATGNKGALDDMRRRQMQQQAIEDMLQKRGLFGGAPSTGSASAVPGFMPAGVDKTGQQPAPVQDAPVAQGSETGGLKSAAPDGALSEDDLLLLSMLGGNGNVDIGVQFDRRAKRELDKSEAEHRRRQQDLEMKALEMRLAEAQRVAREEDATRRRGAGLPVAPGELPLRAVPEIADQSLAIPREIEAIARAFKSGGRGVDPKAMADAARPMIQALVQKLVQQGAKPDEALAYVLSQLDPLVGTVGWSNAPISSLIDTLLPGTPMTDNLYALPEARKAIGLNSY